MPTDELTLQYAYDLSKNESKVYSMRTEGYSIKEISDYMGLSYQAVKNLMHSANVKRKDKMMNFVVVIQDDNTRRSIADMCLKVLATDTENTNLHIGKYTEILFNSDAELGNTDFIIKDVLKQIDPIVHNEMEANKKAKEIYTKYLELGGRKGQMGFGWVVWIFNKFRVKYEIYQF